MTDRHPISAPPPAAPTWHVDRAPGRNPRRILKGATPVAYATTDAGAHHIAHMGNVVAVLVATLEIIRDVLAGMPDFQGRMTFVSLIDTAIRYGRGGTR